MRYTRQVRQNGEDLECQSLDFILQAMGGHLKDFNQIREQRHNQVYFLEKSASRMMEVG